MDHSESGSVGPDTNGESDQHGKAETFVVNERAQAILEVAEQGIVQWHTYRYVGVAARFRDKRPPRMIDSKYHSLIRPTLQAQLRFEPNTEMRNRKPLERQVEFEANWELRFGPDNRFRVFYAVSHERHEYEDRIRGGYQSALQRLPEVRGARSGGSHSERKGRGNPACSRGRG